MTLGSLGGKLKPLTHDELRSLPPVINLVTLGQALGVSEPVIREMRRQGKLAELGIRVLPMGAQYRVPTADVLQLLGVGEDGQAGAA